MPVNAYKIFLFLIPSLFAVFPATIKAETVLSGGNTTVFQKGPNAFGLPLANITRTNRRAHVVGNSFFNKNWVFAPSSTTARDGLGPLYHARSCSGCHVRDGRGAPPQNNKSGVGLLFRLNVPGMPGGDPNLGQQLAVKAAPGVEPEGKVKITYQLISETLSDGEIVILRKPNYTLIANPVYGKPHPKTLVGPRLAQPLVGLGLLESIDEKSILNLADPDDKNKDGISGKANYVLNQENGKTELGRFGWKASQPSLRLQAAVAFFRDMGITSSIHPNEDFAGNQDKIIKSIGNKEGPEIDDPKLGRVVTYLKTLAPPAQRNQEAEPVQKGEAIFMQIGCANCHVQTLKTASIATIDELENQTIRPYTDLLLHDMGDALADGINHAKASGKEWRTPPLWGIGLTEIVNGNAFFLHDGRARNLQEAIMWHSGEGFSAKKAYSNLSKTERSLVLNFLRSL